MKEIKVVSASKQGDFELSLDGQRFSLFLGAGFAKVGDVLSLQKQEPKKREEKAPKE